MPPHFGSFEKQVSSHLDHKKGQWVYLIVQNKKGGEITTLCDNRRVIEDLASAKTPEVSTTELRSSEG